MPVESLAITESGLELRITPFEESTGDYRLRRLRLMDAEQFVLDVVGKFASEDLCGLEVNAFKYEFRQDALLDGTIIVLVGSAGCWRIAFRGARWELTDG